MKKIFNLLKAIDLSSVSYGFHINGQENYQTILGGSIYLIWIISVIYYLILSSIEFFTRTNYNIINFQKILPSPAQINITENKLNFGFSIIDENSNPLQKELLDRYFIIKLRHITRKRKEKYTEDIKLIQCNEDNFKNEFNIENYFFKNKKYLDYFCMQNWNYTIEGSYNDQLFTYFDYSISLNWTAVKEENMDFMNNFYSKRQYTMMFKFFDYSIDLDNFENPVKAFENEVFDVINFNMIKKLNVDFSLYFLLDDKNLLSSDPNTLVITNIDKIKSYSFTTYDRNPNLNDYKLLFKLYIRSSFNNNIIKRIYLKLPEFLSLITGIGSNSLLIIIIFNTYYNSFKSGEELVNTLLRFKENFTNEESINMKINNLNNLYKKKFGDGKVDRNKKSSKEENPFERQITFNHNKNVTSKSKNNCIYKFDSSKDLISLQIDDSPCDKKRILSIPFKTYKTEFSKDNLRFDNNNPITINDIIIEEGKNENSFNLESFSQKKSNDYILSKNSFNVIKNFVSNKTEDISNNKLSISDDHIFNKSNRNLFQINLESFPDGNQGRNRLHSTYKIIQKKKNSNRDCVINSKLMFSDLLNDKLYDNEGNSVIFDFSVFHIFCKTLFNCSKYRKDRMILYEKAFDSVDNNLNIFFYLKFIQELSVMKKALFSNEETKIIDFIAKPMISEEDNEENVKGKEIIQDKLMYEKNLNEVLKAYELTLKKKAINDNGKNLLKLFNDELKSIYSSKE